MVVAVICPEMNKVASSHTEKHLSESLLSSIPLTESSPLLLGIAPSRKKRDNTYVRVVIRDLGTELMPYSIISVDGRECCEKAFGFLSYKVIFQGEVLWRREGFLL